jgi:uncharacterized membrane protein
MRILSALLVFVAIVLSIKGFRRRRGTWSNASWKLFGFAVLLSIVPCVGGFLLGAKLDEGFRLGNTSAMRSASFLTMFAVAVFAFSVPIHVLGWFATGEPDRQMKLPFGSRDHFA